MKRLMIVTAIMLGVLQLHAGAKENLERQLKETKSNMENNACWNKSGVQKICGLQLGATAAEINTAGVLQEQLDASGKKRQLYGKLKKPFRTITDVRLYFSPKGRLYYIELSGEQKDFESGKAEFEATYKLITKKFGDVLGTQPGNHEGMGNPDNNSCNWELEWKHYYRPTSPKSKWIGGEGPVANLELSRAYLKLKVNNGPLARYDVYSKEAEEIEAKIKALRPDDEGADAL